MKWVKVFENISSAQSRLDSNRTLRISIGELKICLAEFDNQYFAVNDQCPHNKEQLSKGQINHLGEIICPWHNYRFRLSDGASITPGCDDAITYPVRSTEDGLYLGLPD